jgi:hypothetical protein
LHGIGLLKDGLIWRVGDETKVADWDSNWIPRVGAQRPLGHKPDLQPDVQVHRVDKLLNEQGTGCNERKAA